MNAPQSTLNLTSAPASQIEADVLVLGATSAPEASRTDNAAPVLLTDGVDTRCLDLKALSDLLPSLGFSGALDEVVRVPASAVTEPGSRLQARVVLVVGAGKELQRAAEPRTCDAAALGDNREGVLRRMAGRAARALAGAGSAALLLPTDDLEALVSVSEGALSAAYSWQARVPGAKAPVRRLLISTPLADQDAAREVTDRAQALAEATCLTRDLVNEPPNRLTPEVFAEQALQIGQEAGLSVEVLDEEALAKGGFGGILGVGQGSVHPPRLVRLDWAPQGEDLPSVALIGKGITFDSGGLSLKPPASMPEMKSDMAGAATVLGTVLAAARLALPVRVTAWLAMAENMPGADAQRPSDIVTMYGGTTVEITNTDAEGRLVMADALARAVQEEPDVVLDVATLTGAQIVALGDRVAGVMGTPAVRDEVAAAAARAGESFWAMPLPEHLRPVMDSPVASLRNAAVGSRSGGMLTAGLFLREFVGTTPWAHLDIAGPSFNEGSPWGGTPSGGTGAGVATLLEVLRGRA